MAIIPNENLRTINKINMVLRSIGINEVKIWWLKMASLVITIDVETDHACFAGSISGFRGVEVGLPKYLDFFSCYGYPVTLFISGDVLEKINKSYVDENTVEISSHGFKHTYPPHYLTSLNNDRLIEEIVHSKQMLQSHFNTEVLGFRAHGLNINSHIMGLLSKNYVYDSSIILNTIYESGTLNEVKQYNPSKSCVVSEGKLPIIELPVYSENYKLFNIPFIGAYIRLLPKRFFMKSMASFIIFDLHCQDVVQYNNWKYLYVDGHLNKFKKIIDHYEDKGYDICIMKKLLSGM